MKLYYSPGACSLASHIAAIEADLPLDLEKVDLKTHKTEKGEDYKRINPKGYVPALLLDDGNLLTENIAVLPYLGDIRPDAKLAPPPRTLARAQFREWLGYITSEIHASFAPIFQGAGDDERKKAVHKITTRLSYADEHLRMRPYLLGENLTVADCYLFVMLTWLDKARIPITTFSQLPHYRDTIASRPTVRRAMREEGLA